MNKCEFELIGGLGNQLFILAAALQHTDAGYDTRINYGNLSRYGNSHGNSILDLEFKGLMPEFGNFGSPLDSFAFRVASKLSRESRIRNIGNWRIENETGFVDLSHKKSSHKRHFGYFQSVLDLSQSRREQLSIVEPRHKSKEFEYFQDLGSTEKPVIIHLRRGDYVKYAHTLGVLSTEYYVRLVEEIMLVESNSPLWIFSDNPEVASALQENLRFKSRIFLPSDKLTDVESLCLMTLGSAHIIANSTFSWWGAFLAKNSRIVYSPAPWFLNAPEPLSLIPQNWETRKSLWEFAQ
jgi:hypothetical protein